MSYQATVCSVAKSNGAYRVDYYHTYLTEDLGSSETVDVASSLAVAKRVAKQAARDLGYQGPFKWLPDGRGDWVLVAMIEETDDAY